MAGGVDIVVDPEWEPIQMDIWLRQRRLAAGPRHGLHGGGGQWSSAEQQIIAKMAQHH